MIVVWRSRVGGGHPREENGQFIRFGASIAIVVDILRSIEPPRALSVEMLSDIWGCFIILRHFAGMLASTLESWVTGAPDSSRMERGNRVQAPSSLGQEELHTHLNGGYSLRGEDSFGRRELRIRPQVGTRQAAWRRHRWVGGSGKEKLRLYDRFPGSHIYFATTWDIYMADGDSKGCWQATAWRSQKTMWCQSDGWVLLTSALALSLDRLSGWSSVPVFPRLTASSCIATLGGATKEVSERAQETRSVKRKSPLPSSPIYHQVRLHSVSSPGLLSNLSRCDFPKHTPASRKRQMM